MLFPRFLSVPLVRSFKLFIDTVGTHTLDESDLTGPLRTYAPIYLFCHSN